MDDDELRRDRILSEDLLGKVEATFELVSQIALDVPEMKGHLERIDGRLDRVEGRLSSVELRLESVETIVREHSGDLKEIKQLVGGHAEAITELKAASHTH